MALEPSGLEYEARGKGSPRESGTTAWRAPRAARLSRANPWVVLFAVERFRSLPRGRSGAVCRLEGRSRFIHAVSCLNAGRTKGIPRTVQSVFEGRKLGRSG